MVVLPNETRVYKVGKLNFIFYNKDIIIKTSLGQTFFLEPTGYWTPAYNRGRLALIKSMIVIGEIRDLNELAGYTRPGLKWAGTSLCYDISNCNIKEL